MISTYKKRRRQHIAAAPFCIYQMKFTPRRDALLTKRFRDETSYEDREICPWTHFLRKNIDSLRRERKSTETPHWIHLGQALDLSYLEPPAQPPSWWKFSFFLPFSSSSLLNTILKVLNPLLKTKGPTRFRIGLSSIGVLPLHASQPDSFQNRQRHERKPI